MVAAATENDHVSVTLLTYLLRVSLHWSGHSLLPLEIAGSKARFRYVQSLVWFKNKSQAMSRGRCEMPLPLLATDSQSSIGIVHASSVLSV